MSDPIDPSEVSPGLVVELDQEMLEDDAGIHKAVPQRQAVGATPRRGPFVCIAVSGARSTWTPLTLQSKSGKSGKGKEYLRLALPVKVKVGGDPTWTAVVSYLNDGANLYEGDTVQILKASQVDLSETNSRRYFRPEGVTLILAEVKRQTRRQINPLPSP